jgi:hypothetical protein
MNTHTTHWSRDGMLHCGTVEGCESCDDDLGVGPAPNQSDRTGRQPSGSGPALDPRLYALSDADAHRQGRLLDGRT